MLRMEIFQRYPCLLAFAFSFCDIRYFNIYTHGAYLFEAFLLSVE